MLRRTSRCPHGATMIRVLIADDHPVVRQGIRHMIEGDGDISVTGEVGSGTELLEKARQCPHDVILLDISMPGMSGIEALKQLSGARPPVPVLVISMHPEEQYALRAIRAGASGYLNKEAPPEELTRAIRKVAAGGKYVSPSLAESLATMVGSQGGRPPHESLSDREYEVMTLLASGKPAVQIAEELALSPKTISIYRSRILSKLGLKNTAQLVRYALQNNLAR